MKKRKISKKNKKESKKKISKAKKIEIDLNKIKLNEVDKSELVEDIEKEETKQNFKDFTEFIETGGGQVSSTRGGSPILDRESREQFVPETQVGGDTNQRRYDNIGGAGEVVSERTNTGGNRGEIQEYVTYNAPEYIGEEQRRNRIKSGEERVVMRNMQDNLGSPRGLMRLRGVGMKTELDDIRESIRNQGQGVDKGFGEYTVEGKGLEGEKGNLPFQRGGRNYELK